MKQKRKGEDICKKKDVLYISIIASTCPSCYALDFWDPLSHFLRRL